MYISYNVSLYSTNSLNLLSKLASKVSLVFIYALSETSFSFLDLDGCENMNCKSILCVAVALMITSVGCFAALGPGDSDAALDDAPVLSMLESEEAVSSDCITIVLPSYDSTTGTYSSTEYTEVTFHHETLAQASVAVTDGGVTKVEPFFYYLTLLPELPSTIVEILCTYLLIH